MDSLSLRFAAEMDIMRKKTGRNDTVFSKEARCIYRRNQLGEVICQLRFPEIPDICEKEPAAFQEAIRELYPLYEARQDFSAPRITGEPGNFQLEKAPPTVNHSFSSEDRRWRVNLTSRFISLSCQKYTCWEEFAGMLDQPLAEFIKLYRLAGFERIGLRYMNFISRKALDLEEPFRELLQPQYLGVLADEQIPEAGLTRANVDAEFSVRGGCRAKIHSGTGLIRKGQTMDPEVKLIFDQDVYMPGQIPVNLTAASLETLHSQAWSIFRGAITDRLHEAMEPEEI